MHAFDTLMDIADKLNGPKGCPWDIKQTFTSLQPYVLEEAHEVVEAVDTNQDPKILEELGDLFYIVIFYAKIAEREGRFTIKDILKTIEEKLIRRHPHVFGDEIASHPEEVLKRWEEIKKQEKAEEKPKSLLEGMPATLPLLVKAQKMVKKMHRKGAPTLPKIDKVPLSEEALGEKLFSLIASADALGIDTESALRRTLARYEERYHTWEEEKAHPLD